MTAVTVSLFPIRGEPDQVREIFIDTENQPRRWAFFHIDGEATTKAYSRTISEYAFSHILYHELLTSQKFVSSATSADPGTAGQKFGSFTLIVSYKSDNYPLIAAFNKAYANGKSVQLSVVDQIEGGEHSSQVISISGVVVTYMLTANYALIRIALYAYCNGYRMFKQDPGKAMVCGGNLDGYGYDFYDQSSDTSKPALKHLIEESGKAISKGLSGI